MTDVPAPPCLRSDAASSGATALAVVSTLDGTPVTIAEVFALAGMQPPAAAEEGTTLVLARVLGYEAVAMEGGYDDLPDVRLPLVVALHEDGRQRYAVLHAVDKDRATVGDPLTGETGRWSRERLCALWTGSVVQVTPLADERAALAARLEELRDPVRRALRAAGWSPPYGKRVAMLAGWGALVAGAALAPRTSARDGAWAALVAAACAGSLWSWLASDACARCSRARWLAGGLPVAPAGALLYASLLTTTYGPVAWRLFAGAAICAALGAHVTLVAQLARARLACWPCFFVAGCATAAAATSIARADVGLPAAVVALVLAAAAVVALVPLARAREERIARSIAEGLARSVAAEPRPTEGARLVVYKRKGCSACAFYEAAVRPALVATFGDALHVEERELGGARTLAPVVIVLGARTTLFVGLPVEAIEDIGAAVRDALSDGPAAREITVHVAA